ncbi:MAG: hypothetical protein AAGC60_25490 [Acidobacteriota bacterium]
MLRNSRAPILRTLFICCMLLATGPAFGQELGHAEPPSWSFDDLAVERYVQARHEAELLAMPGVRGVGIGLGEDGLPALLVMVEGDAARARAAIPARLDGVAVRVAEVVGGGATNGGTGCVGSGGCHDQLFAKPIPMGTSTSSQLACDAGTLGFKACDATQGYAGYVTAMHVATRDASFCEGRAPIGTQQVHRGKAETSPTCNSNFAIGSLDRFVPVNATGNLVDAAFVRSNDNRTSPSTLDYSWLPTAAVAPALGTCVVKSGRTTGFTPARVLAVNVNASVPKYCLNEPARTERADFSGLFQIGYDDGSCGTCADPPCWDVAKGGDSGSAVYNKLLKGFLHGLLFANVGFRNSSDPDGVEEQGLVAPAPTVLSELDLELCLINP